MLRRISQRALHRRSVELADRPLASASLFPLFDEGGRTRALLIASAGDPRILVVNWRPDLFTRPLPWRRRLAVRSTELRDVELADAERLAELWHFDPWWVLGEERYVGHPAVPALRRTNIPGWDADVSEVWFEPRLEGAVRIGRGHGEGLVARRFEPHALAEATRARSASDALPDRRRRARTGWRLRPFWERAAR